MHNRPVTFRIGPGIFASAPDAEDELVSFADKLMCRIKLSGKNNDLTEVFETRRAYSKQGR